MIGKREAGLGSPVIPLYAGTFKSNQSFSRKIVVQDNYQVA